MSEVTPQTTPEQVAAFLKGKGLGTSEGQSPMPEPAIKGPDVQHEIGNLPPLAEEFIQSTATPKAVDPNTPGAEPVPGSQPTGPEKRIEVDPNPLVDPDNPTMEATVAWQMETAHLGHVEVTDEEKVLYLKATLNNATLYWDIKLLNGRLTAKVRSLNQYEFDVIFRALRLDEKDEIVVSPEQKFSRLQYYNCCLSVVELQKEPTGALEFKRRENADLDADANRLRDFHKERFSELYPPKWNQMITAARVFSIKEKLCNEALANEDFWPPADFG